MKLKSAPPRGHSEAKTSASVAAAWDKNRRHARARTPPNPGARFHSKRLTAVRSLGHSGVTAALRLTADEPPDKKKIMVNDLEQSPQEVNVASVYGIFYLIERSAFRIT